MAAGCVCVQPGEKSRGVEEEKSSDGATRSELYFSVGAVWVVCGCAIDWRRAFAGRPCRTAEQVVDSASSTEPGCSLLLPK
jgi:hypothetical protein